MLVAGACAAVFPLGHPLSIAFLVAIGAAVAKTAHYYFFYFTRRLLSHKTQVRLEGYGRKFEKYGPIVVLAAAATPIPDEPVVAPLGLMRYNVAKFFIIFFAGKMLITSIGAFLGKYVALTLEAIAGNAAALALSLASTIVITVILIKVDLGGFFEQVKKFLFPTRSYPREKTLE